MKEHLTRAEIEYRDKYSHYPDSQDELLKYIKTKYKINEELINERINAINNIPWKEINITIPIIPKGSPRPRLNGKSNRFYVKGASDNKKIIRKIINKSNIIFTRTELLVKTYQPTPTYAMSGTEIYLAQLGYIRPQQKSDWDNLGKTYCDMLEGILLLNDNIICDGNVKKYFSLKPRVEIYIKYQDHFDSRYNERKIKSSKTYKLLEERGEL